MNRGDDATKDLKILIPIDERSRWPAILATIMKLTCDHREARVRVVVDGNAAFAFQGPTDIGQDLAQAAEAGVELQVSADALLEHRLDSAKRPECGAMVLMGVIVLAQAQNEGFAYVKPQHAGVPKRAAVFAKQASPVWV